MKPTVGLAKPGLTPQLPDALRQVVAFVRRHHPFTIHAWVVLPEHLHCVIELPPGAGYLVTPLLGTPDSG